MLIYSSLSPCRFYSMQINSCLQGAPPLSLLGVDPIDIFLLNVVFLNDYVQIGPDSFYFLEKSLLFREVTALMAKCFNETFFCEVLIVPCVCAQCQSSHGSLQSFGGY